MTAEPGFAIVPDAAEEEAAAILTAFTLYLAEDSEESPPPLPSRWALAGRLEAMHLPVNPASLRHGWRA